MESKLYVLCSDKLDPVYACVQGGHAVAQYIMDNRYEIDYWKEKKCWMNDTIVYLYCDIKKIINIIINECYVPYSEWEEPDCNNEITAIAIWNQDILNCAKTDKIVQNYIDKLEIIKAGS